jgi:FKBP-type peptidyl-prolyl cis-trans isomerase
MKKIIVFLMAVAVITNITSCRTSQKATAGKQVADQPYLLSSSSDSASYAIGVNYGFGLKENMKAFPGGEYNLYALAEGFVKAMNDSAALLIAPEAAQGYIQNYIQSMMEKDAEAEKTKGEAFLAENKNNDGVITTESGLQYKVLTQGEGKIPTDENQVKVHYTGQLLDGTVFDSSVQRGEPVVFGVTQVIKGWTEILQRMPVGSKYIAWIPTELAYGLQGAGEQIKPNSMLIFEIELIDIVE